MHQILFKKNIIVANCNFFCGATDFVLYLQFFLLKTLTKQNCVYCRTLNNLIADLEHFQMKSIFFTCKNALPRSHTQKSHRFLQFLSQI